MRCMRITSSSPDDPSLTRYCFLAAGCAELVGNSTNYKLHQERVARHFLIKPESKIGASADRDRDFAAPCCHPVTAKEHLPPQPWTCGALVVLRTSLRIRPSHFFYKM